MSSARLMLDSRLDFAAVAPLVETLQSLRGANLTLDAGGVGHIGALAVQAIRSAARTWAEDGYQLTLSDPGNDLSEQINLLGYSAQSLTEWEPRA